MTDGYWWADGYQSVDLRKPTACECGMRSVLKKEEDNWELHSSYCPVYKDKTVVPVNIKEEVIKLTKGIP